VYTRQQIFLYIQDKWGATLKEQLEILENKFLYFPKFKGQIVAASYIENENEME
jgi:hypothetical protein